MVKPDASILPPCICEESYKVVSMDDTLVSPYKRELEFLRLRL